MGNLRKRARKRNRPKFRSVSAVCEGVGVTVSPVSVMERLCYCSCSSKTVFGLVVGGDCGGDEVLQVQPGVVSWCGHVEDEI